MKTIDQREMQNTSKKRKIQIGARGTEAIAKGSELNDFVVQRLIFSS